MTIKWVFFDIDNTLFDTDELAERVRRNSIRAMIDMGLRADEVKAYEQLKKIIKMLGSNSDMHYNELVKYFNGRDEAKIIAAGVAAYHDTKIGYLKPYADVIPTLIEMKKHYKLGIISNGDRIKQWEKLIRLGVAHFFDIVLISGEMKMEKPALPIFESAAREAGCKPQEAVMIGDKESDMAAKSIGMYTINSKKDITRFGDLVGKIAGIREEGK